MTINSGGILALNNTTTSTPVYQHATTFSGAGTLQKTGAGTVVFGNNSGNVTVSLSAGGLIDVQAGILVGSSSNNGVWTNNHASLNIAAGATFQGAEADIRVDALTGAGTLTGGYSSQGSVTVGVDGGAGTFAGTLANSGNSGGVLTLRKAGSGTQILTGANTYTGTTTIVLGTLQIGAGGVSGNLGTGGVTDNATLTFNRSDNLTVPNAIGGTGSLIQAGTGTLTLMGAATYTGGTSVQNGTLAIATSLGGSSLTVDGTDMATAAAALGTSGSLSVAQTSVGVSGIGTFLQTGGTHTVTGTDAGTNQLYLGVNPTGNGSYVLQGGQLLAPSIDVGDHGKGNLTLNGGLAVVGTTLDVAYFAGGTGTLALNGGTLRVGTGVLGGSGTSTLLFNGGTLQAGANTSTLLQNLGIANFQAGGLRLDTNGYNVTVPQNLGHDTSTYSTTDGGLTKLGAGTLTLTGTNTFNGGLTINAGTVSVATDAALGASNSAVTLNNGGRLMVTGASFTTARTFNLNFGSLTPVAGGSITYKDATVNGGFLGTGGTHVLGGTTTSLNGVTTALNSTVTQSAGTAALNDAEVRGSFTQGSLGTLNASDTVFTSAATLTVGGTVNASGVEIDGVTTINSAGQLNGTAGALVLGGGSRTTLSGGTLAAAAGTSIELNGGLLINNGKQTGTLHVNYGSTAKGTGTFGNVTVGDGGKFGVNASMAGSTSGLAVFRLTGANGLASTAFVGPQFAMAPGTVNVASLALGSGSVFAFSVQDAQGAAGSGYDLAHVSGTLTLAAGTVAGSQITISVASLNGGGTAGQAANFDPSHNYSFVLVQADGGVSGYNPAEFVVDSSSFQNSTQGGSFSVGQQGNNLVLVFTTAVPEPNTWALLGVGAATLGLVTQRRGRLTKRA